MPPAQRKDDILQAELPSTLPLMALRSTIVYPLGTIAVQMGAPENLALLKANEQAGLIVGLVVASGDHDDVLDTARFVGRVGVAARVHERINLPGDTVQITLQGLRRIVVDEIEQNDPFPIAVVHPAKDVAADSSEVTDLITRVASAAETLAEMVDRIPDEVPAILKMNVSDPGRFADLAATNMNFRISDKDEVLQRLDVGQRLRFILSRLEREVARARDGGREAADGDQDRAAPARVLPAPAAARDSGGARRGRSRREGSDRASQENRRSQAAGESGA